MIQETEHTGGAIVARDGFSEQSIETTGSTVEAVMAAREKAMVEARFVVAKKFPRSMDAVRSKLLKAVERPGFADSDIDKGNGKQPGSAWYKLPGYDNAEGFSIRFAEECMRVMGNLDVKSSILWEDDKKRIIEVTVFDIENNIAIPKQTVLEKTMERRFVKRGEVALGTRVTSSNKVNYILPADEAEMTKKQSSAESKAIRNAILRLVPGDIQAECRRRIMEIRHGDAAKDPDGARKRMIDAFAALNVTPGDLEEYAGDDLDKLSPAQIDHMRQLHKAIKSGETTWKAVIEEVREEREGNGDDAPKEKPKPTLSTIAEDNRRITDEKKQPEKPDQPKAAPDATGELRQRLIDLSKRVWGSDNNMVKLSEFCRKQNFAVMSATKEQLTWAISEMEPRAAAKEQK
jgi:hypothetical protein